MCSLLNRITWVLSILFGIWFIFIDDDLFFIWLIAAVGMKFALFSPGFIQRAVNSISQKVSSPDLLENFSEPQEISELNLEKKNEEPQDSVKVNFDGVLLEKEKHENMEIEEKNISFTSKSQNNDIVPQENDLKPNFIEEFFSENLLAKLWGIIVFIGVLFFLSVIYSIIGPVWKMIIGFAIWFTLYGAGVLIDKKEMTAESRILMWVGILVNYLVILSGRHLLDGLDLGSGITLIFLILNTVFAVVTSLVYNSSNLLLFSIIIAYINPFLLGDTSGNSYILLSYTVIITLGAFFLSYKQTNFHLFVVSFVFANWIFLITPYSDSALWVTKLLCINTIWVLSLYVSTVFKEKYSLISESLIGGIYALIWVVWFMQVMSLSILEFSCLALSALTLMYYTYFYARRKAYLYSLGTLGAIITLSPALFLHALEENFVPLVSLISIIIVTSSVIYTLVQKAEYITKNLSNILAGLLSSAAFATLILYTIWNQFFPWVALGFAYVVLAAIYGFSGIYMVLKNEEAENLKTLFEVYTGIAISIFSLAIVFIFANHPEVISIIWLLEASLLYHFTTKKTSDKIYLAANILFFLSFVRLAPIIEIAEANYGLLVTVWVIFTLLGKNILIVNSHEKSFPEYSIFHNIVHLLFSGLLWLIILFIFEFFQENEWLTLLFTTIYITALGIFYRYLNSIMLKIVSNIALLWVMALHIFANILALEGWFFGIFDSNIFVSLIILALPSSIFFYEQIKNWVIFSSFTLMAYIFSIFAISSLYILNIFEVSYALTAYWAILSFVLLGIWITKETPYLRTIGLYLLSLTVLKIFFNDIWKGSTADGVGFLAFIVTGILMIVLSTMYSKHLGKDALKKDFSPTNLFPKKEVPTENLTTVAKEIKKTETLETKNTENSWHEEIMKDLSEVDVSDIKSVRLNISWDTKKIIIRADNLLRIAKIITTSVEKNTFSAGELQKQYNYITENYRTQIPKAQYEKIKTVVKEFVDKWGEIIFIKK